MTDEKFLILRFAAEVRAARALLGWSQVELADHSRTSQGCVSRIESGKHVDLHLVNALRVACALGVSFVELHQGDPTPTLRVFRQLAEILLQEPEETGLDAIFAALLHAYHGLTAERQRTFVRVILPLAEFLRGGPD